MVKSMNKKVKSIGSIKKILDKDKNKDEHTLSVSVDAQMHIEQMHSGHMGIEQAHLESVLGVSDLPLDPNQEFLDSRTFGERVSDRISAFGGSWTFIIIFMLTLCAWALLNTAILGPLHDSFDPYPYIFLNLILSMLAAIQAPIIMMSQVRQNARDRHEAQIDHDVNVRSDIAISLVAKRMDDMAQQLANISKLLEQKQENQQENQQEYQQDKKAD